jgi:hypothetical protein
MSYKLGREDSYNSASAEARVSYDYSEEDMDAEAEEKGDGDLVLLQPTAEEAWSMPRAEAKGETVRISPGKGTKLVQQLNLSSVLAGQPPAVLGSSSLSSSSQRPGAFGEGRDFDYDEPNIQENTVLVRAAILYTMFVCLRSMVRRVIVLMIRDPQVVFDLPDGSMGENTVIISFLCVFTVSGPFMMI